jgi:hypothetical protein
MHGKENKTEISKLTLSIVFEAKENPSKLNQA